MSRQSVELRERRARIVAEIRSLTDKAHQEKRDFNGEEQQTFDKGMSDVDNLLGQIERMEKLEAAEREIATMGESRGVPAGDGGSLADDPNERLAAAKRRAAYRHWLQTGEVQAAIRDDRRRAELRDTIIGTDSKGGYLILPVELTTDIVKPLNDLVFVRRLATITKVTQAKALGIRKRSTRMADADWTTEVAAVTEDTTGAYDRRDLTPYLCSKLAKVSMVTLMLSTEAESEIRDELAYKFGVTEEKAFLTGNGTNKPLGVFTASASGISTARDVVAANAASIVADDLVNVKYALKQQYWGNAQWALNRAVVKVIRKLKVASTTGGNDLEYVWAPGLTDGASDKILGHAYNVSEYAPGTITTGLYTALLGDFRFYRIAELVDMALQRLTELYSGTNEIGFIGRRWVDGAPIMEEAFSRLKQA